MFEWDDPGGVHFGIAGYSAVRPDSWPSENKLAYESSLGDLGAKATIAKPHGREEALRDRFLFELFGDVRERPPRVRWRCGFIDGVFIPQHSASGYLEEMLIGLLEHPKAMAMTELGLGEISRGGGLITALGYDAEIDVLAVLAPSTLRRLVIGAWAEHDISWTSIRDLTDLYPSLPGLESLELQAGQVNFGEITLPSLKSLLVRSGGLPDYAIESLQHARGPELESLTVWFGSADYGGCESVTAARPFLEAGQFPKLRSLGLANAAFTDELCELLPKAPILPQLRALDLSLGTIGPDGAQILIRNRDRFAHLEHLNLRSNSIPDSLHKALSTLCPSVDLRYQKTSRNYRYVTVAE